MSVLRGRRKRALFAALVAITTIGLVAIAGAIDRRSYIQRNLALFRSVPVYPGARLKEVDESGYRANELPGAKIVGYGTSRVYLLRKSVKPRSMTSFYRQALRSRWRLLQTYEYRRFGQLNLRRGDAYLEVFATPGEVDIEIDHNCYKGHRTPVCFGP